MSASRLVATASLAVMAIAAVVASIVAESQPASARERSYFIAAEEIRWSYAPSGRDLVFDKPLPQLAPAQLGWTYRKLVYRGYTDATFAHPSPVAAQDAYLGLLGPAIHAEVGDTVAVTFKNLTDVRVGFDPVGGLVGAPNQAIAPGATRTYRYSVPESAGPASMDASSTLSSYHATDGDFAEYDDAGLFGPIVITRHGSALPDGAPSDVDREIFAMFSMSFESRSPLFKDELGDLRLNPRKVAADASTILNDNIIVSINGYDFGNMPMITLREGQRVRWYVLSTTNLFDFQNPTWNGETVVVAGHRTDSADVLPSETAIADMTPDNPGTWMFWCAQNAFLVQGMDARFTVRP